MGRTPCCDKTKVKRGQWSPEEDEILKNHILNHGNAGSWITLPNRAGLNRCGKSCRLRWLNYLRPDIKLGNFTQEEDVYLLSLLSTWKWCVIASKLPGRTDNDVKNHWNSKLKKKISATKANFDDRKELVFNSSEQAMKFPLFPSRESADKNMVETDENHSKISASMEGSTIFGTSSASLDDLSWFESYFPMDSNTSDGIWTEIGDFPPTLIS